MTEAVICLLILSPFVIAGWRQGGRRGLINRLNRLVANEDRLSIEEEGKKRKEAEEREISVTALSDRLGKAGYFSQKERRLLVLSAVTVCLAIIGFFGYLGMQRGVPSTVLAIFVSSYICLMLFLYFLRWRRVVFAQDLLFQLPIVLEGIVLLVEAGWGVLPAMQRLIKSEGEDGDKPRLHRILGLVYSLSAHGMPFGQALQFVSSAIDLKPLRHALLHLDISSSEGGELIPSLRSLSDYAHTEWRLSVESRVKRLETLVVFPVFCAVMGLLFLTAAVPAVSVLEFMEGMELRKTNQGFEMGESINQGINGGGLGDV